METEKKPKFLVLASASPRRRELLHAAGIHFVCQPADVDEALLHGENPAAAVQRLARAKAAAVAGRFPHETVLGADTLVVLDGQALGKPRDLDDARRMLGLLSGRTHQVMTGVSLLRLRPPHEETWCCVTDVTFRELSEAVIGEYLGKVHVLDKAGSYAIQECGEMVVAGIRGLRSNVVGLPVEEVAARLAEICHARPG